MTGFIVEINRCAPKTLYSHTELLLGHIRFVKIDIFLIYFWGVEKLVCGKICHIYKCNLRGEGHSGADIPVKNKYINI